MAAALLFRFADRFEVDASAEAVVPLLRDADSWPRWWPQVRSIRRLDDDRGIATIRSKLPFTLRLTLTSLVDDPGAGVFRAGLAGDLDGWIEFKVKGIGDRRTELAYTQECTLGRPVLARVAVAARPLLAWNHRQMMIDGMRGLAAHAVDQ